MPARWFTLAILIFALSLSPEAAAQTQTRVKAVPSTPSKPRAASTASPVSPPEPTADTGKLQEHTVSVMGSFAAFLDPTSPTHRLLAARLVADGVSVVPEGQSIQATLINASQLTLTYKALSTSPQPTTIYLGVPPVADTPFPYVISKLQDSIPPRRLVVSGDFCRPQGPPSQLTCGSKLLPNPNASSSNISGYVYGADGSGYTPVTVHQLQAHSADIEFVADPAFHPTWVVLQTTAGTAGSTTATATFAYVQASPEVATDAVYLANGLDAACRTTTALCVVPPILQSLSPGIAQSIDLLSRHQDLLFTRITGRAGELPDTLTVQLPDRSTFLARRVTTPDNEQSLLAISMNIMDQETVHRNFGAQIAEHYLAIELDVANRSAKKLQFNKSAVWFDVDYRQSSGRYKPTFRQQMSTASVDLIPANPYYTTFSTSGLCPTLTAARAEQPIFPLDGQATTTPPKDVKPLKGPCQVFRYGIEQNQRVFPEDYKTVLNSFDYSTERLDRILRYVELFGGVVNTIATGGAVAQVHNFAFRSSAQILTGNFLPGFRAVSQDLPGTDRLRANLVTDTFQEVVQLPPNGHASTIVILPRDAIFGIQGYEQYVVIERVLNVHIDPDVINGVKDPPVPMNHVQLGYTKDQVRQSLGEPPNVTTAADGTSAYVYSTGPYAKVNFNKDGQVVSWDQRTVTDQLASASTLDSAKQILRDNNLPGTSLTLLNKNTVLVDVTGLDKTLQYDASGKHIADYTLLYPTINASVGKKRSTLETLLGSKVLPSATPAYSPVNPPSKTDKVLTYAMPDVKDATIVVTFTNPPVVNPDATIVSISFQGAKPATVR